MTSRYSLIDFSLCGWRWVSRYVSSCVYTGMCMWWLQVYISCLPQALLSYFLRQCLSLTLGIWLGYTGWPESPWDPLVSVPPRARLQAHATVTWLMIHTGPHACPASTLATEPSPQPLLRYLMLWVHGCLSCEIAGCLHPHVCAHPVFQSWRMKRKFFSPSKGLNVFIKSAAMHIWLLWLCR